MPRTRKETQEACDDLYLSNKRQAVADDLYRKVSTSSRQRSKMVDAYVKLLSKDEIERMYEDADLGESIDPQAQGPEGNGHDLPSCRACGYPGSDDHENCPNCACGFDPDEEDE